MTPEQAFLTDIQADPANDTLRLIYADWLTERGDRRGEFIQMQCRLAQMSEDDPLYEDLLDRQGELLAQHRQEWLRPIIDLARESHCLFRRGFVEEVKTTTAAFLKHGQGLIHLPPLHWLRMWLESGPQGADFATSPLWQHVRGLDVQMLWPGNTNLAILLGSRHLDRLRQLHVRHGEITEDVVDALLANHLEQMEDLQLCLPTGVDAGASALLLAPGRLARLRRLCLVCSSYVPSELLYKARLSRLADLILEGGMVVGRDLIALLNLPELASLSGLELHRVERCAGFLKELAQGSASLNLINLDVPNSRTNDEDIEALARCRAFSKLQRLNLSSTWVTSGGVLALLSSQTLDSLREIVCANTKPTFRDAGVAKLAAHPGLSQITLLNLDNNDIHSDGARALARSRHTGNLRTLSLSGNPIGSDGVRALASGTFPNVRRLHLAQIRITKDDLGALVRAPWMSRVTHLNLTGCGLRTVHAGILANAPGLARLRVLNLASNLLDSKGVCALAASPHLSQLRWLNLDGIVLDGQGVRALAGSATFSRLQDLNLRGSCGHRDQARILAASPYLNRLETLEAADGEGQEMLRERFAGCVAG